MSGIAAPLTRTQQQMFIMAGSNAYRVPVIFRLPAEWDDARIAQAFMIAMRNSPTLQVRYEYSEEDYSFRQAFYAASDEELTLTSREIDVPIEEFCASPELRPDIRNSYPWKAQIVRTKKDRYLCVEFHHICLDGPGLAIFESILLGGSGCAPSDEISHQFAMYSDVARLEETLHAGSIGQRFLGNKELRAEESPLGRRRVNLSSELQAVVTDLARELQVTVRSIYQAGFELALAQTASPDGYAVASNWRWTLRHRVVGSFPALLAQKRVPGDSLPDRARSIFSQCFDPRITLSTELAVNPWAVFSYEQFGLETAEFIAVDEYPKFNLYLRVCVSQSQAFVESENDRRLVSDVERNLVMDGMLAQLGRVSQL